MKTLERIDRILSEAKATDKVNMECIECGKKFKKKIGPRTMEVKCPKCGSYDTEPV
jgi:DNA-directed RNA polymerase subunit RPC12/RpoP